jgi:hypothetical protein
MNNWRRPHSVSYIHAWQEQSTLPKQLWIVYRCAVVSNCALACVHHTGNISNSLDHQNQIFFSSVNQTYDHCFIRLTYFSIEINRFPICNRVTAIYLYIFLLEPRCSFNRPVNRLSRFVDFKNRFQFCSAQCWVRGGSQNASFLYFSDNRERHPLLFFIAVDCTDLRLRVIVSVDLFIILATLLTLK